MPNGVKYSTTVQTNALQRGNVSIGTGNIGPTTTTSFYSLPNPPSGKYIIAKVAASGVPNFFSPQSDAELIQFAKNEGATGADTGSVAAVLAWIAVQSNLEAINFQYENIITNGLVLNLDAGFVGSYPTSGTPWYDLSGNNTNPNLTNGPTFNTSNSGSIVFDGIDDAALQYSPNLSTANGTKTVLCWCWPDSTGPANTYTGLVSWGGRSNASPSDSLLLCLNTTAATWYVGSAYWYNDYNPSILPVNKNAWNMVGIIARQQSVPNSNNTTLICGNSNGLNYDTGTSDPNRSINTQNINLAIGSTDIISRVFKGRIANVLIYNRELSTAEISQNFNAQKARFGL